MRRHPSDLLTTTKLTPIRAALPLRTDRSASTSSWRAGPRQRDTAAHLPPFGDNRAGTPSFEVRSSLRGLQPGWAPSGRSQ